MSYLKGIIFLIFLSMVSQANIAFAANCGSIIYQAEYYGADESNSPPSGTSSDPIIGSRVDLRPDFDVYDSTGNEISANCDNCPGKPLLPGQSVRAKLHTEVSNNDASLFKRDSDSDTIEGPVWWKIEGKTGWNLLGSGEYTISNLDEGESTVESHDWNIPNYPGDTLTMQACVDGDDEIWEESESSSQYKITSPDQSGTTNNCSRLERFYIKHPNYTPTGAIESANCSSIVGWAKDDNTPGSLTVKVYTADSDGSNMQFLESIWANVEISSPSGFYGFEWNIPELLRDGVSRRIYFYAVNFPEGADQLIGYSSLECYPLPPAQLTEEESAIWLLLH